MELREEKHRVESTMGQKIEKFDPETMEDEKIDKDPVTVTTAKTSAVLSAVHHDTPRVAHAQSHDISHNEPVSIELVNSQRILANAQSMKHKTDLF